MDSRPNIRARDRSIRSTSTREKENELIISFRSLLAEETVRESKIRNLSSKGIPDYCGLRGVVWRLLLKYLPFEKLLWPELLRVKRKVNHYILNCVIFILMYTTG